MARRRPGWEIVISTTTTTGLAVARRTYPDLVTFYAPLDFSWATRRAVASGPADGAGPGRAGALAQPGPGGQAVRAPRWRSSTAGSAPGATGAIAAPRPARADAPPARRGGGPERRVRRAVRRPGRARGAGPGHRLGQVRRPGERPEQPKDARAAAGRWACRLADLVFVAGSTMEGEEAAALAAYRAARLQHPRLRLVLVPRHAERFDRVADWLARQGERVVRRSQAGAAAASWSQAVASAGDPGRHDRRAGRGLGPGRRRVRRRQSLVPGRGGQNMMEPAAYRRLGPVRAAHRAISARPSSSSSARNGARRVADAEELTLRLCDDLDDPEAAAARGDGRPDVRPGPARRLGPDPRRARPPGRGSIHSKVGLNLSRVPS